jgi:hypothetical protein
MEIAKAQEGAPHLLTSQGPSFAKTRPARKWLICRL